MRSRIQLHDVAVRFPGRRLVNSSAHGHLALSGIDLDIRAGEQVGLIGPNGSGKSTLLRVMAGIYAPTQGHVRVDGMISSLLTMGMGMQMDYSGYRNIDLSLLVAGVAKDDREGLAQQIAAFSELGEFLHEPVRNYSSGMAMRLRFACATAIRPDVLLLDEWIGAGDADFRDKATERMNGLVNEAGIVVLATHNVPLMKRVCNKAVWLQEGRIMAKGDIDAVVEAHQRFGVYGELPETVELTNPPEQTPEPEIEDAEA